MLASYQFYPGPSLASCLPPSPKGMVSNLQQAVNRVRKAGQRRREEVTAGAAKGRWAFPKSLNLYHLPVVCVSRKGPPAFHLAPSDWSRLVGSPQFPCTGFTCAHNPALTPVSAQLAGPLIAQVAS